MTWHPLRRTNTTLLHANGEDVREVVATQLDAHLRASAVLFASEVLFLLASANVSKTDSDDIGHDPLQSPDPSHLEAARPP